MRHPRPLGPLVLSADIFANSLVPDQGQQDGGPDLDPKCGQTDDISERVLWKK